jgi:hypothetical protein
VELVSLIGVLRRRRLLVALGLVLAAAVAAMAGGVVSGGGGSSSQISNASVHVLIDTRVPLIATSGAAGQDTIVPRAVYLATRMQSTIASEQIAKSVGIPRDSLSVLAPTLPPLEEFSLVPDGQLPTVTAKVTQLPRTAYVVALNPNYTVPVIAIDTAAPNPKAALTLARATIAAMQSAIQPPSETGAASSRPRLPELRVVPLGAPASLPRMIAGTHLRRGVLAAVVVFMIWCVAIVIGSGVARLWRHTAAPAPPVVSPEM